MNEQDKFDQLIDKEKPQAQLSAERDALEVNQVRASLIYDFGDQFLFEVGAELEQVFSSSIPVTSAKKEGGANPPFPTLEIILYSAATLVALKFIETLLAEATKDIYNHLKSKFSREKNKNTEQASVKVFNEKATVGGTALVDDYQSFADALVSAHKMVDEAIEKWDLDPNEVPEGPSLHHIIDDKGIVTFSDLQFQFKYDKTAKKWILESVHKPW
jgi:hypothetical protein